MSATTNSKILAYDTIKKSFDYLKCENGILSVSGSGGTGGDASAANQLTQIGLETTMRNDLIIIKNESIVQTNVQEAINDKIDTRITKCNTDSVVIDSSTPVNTLNLAKVYNTLNNGYITIDSDQNLRVAGNVNINSTKRGAKNNVHSGLLDAGAFTGFFNVSLYGKDAIISYDDTSIYRTNTFSIFGSLTEVADDRAYLGSLVPVVAGSKRLAASKIDLGPFNYLCVQNNDTQSITSNISVYSS